VHTYTVFNKEMETEVDCILEVDPVVATISQWRHHVWLNV